MKSVLLLAAVYSLIIHQWHKEKGSSKVRQAPPATLEVKKDRVIESPAQYTVAAPFLSLYSNLNK